MTAALASPVHVVTTNTEAATLLEPARLRLVQELREPASAAELARRLGQPRQRINYHLRELEKAGLVKLVEERRRGNCTERVVQARASAYVVSPEVLGTLGADPAAVRDRFSSAYLISVAAETIREVAILRNKAQDAGKKLPTLSMQTHVRVASPEALSACASEIANAIATIVARYHDEDAPEGRVFKVNLGSYPAITRDLDAGQGEQPGDTPEPPETRNRKP